MTKETLHLYRDEDGNVYAARDLAHAKELWMRDTGQPSEDAGEWQSIPDERAITFCDDDGPGKTTKFASEWAAEAHAPGCVGGYL